MTSRAALAALLMTLLAALAAPPAAGQAPPPGPPGRAALPRVFIDWPGADIGALRSEIPFVELVPGLETAQVRVVVAAPTGPPGRGEIVIEFTGLGEFQGDDNRLAYAPPPGAAPEEGRKGISGTIKLGLLRYAAKTPAAKDLSIRFLDQAKPTSVNDPWNFWVFSLSANAFLMGETQYRNGSYYGSVSASRVTPALKVRTSVYGNLNKSRFDFGGGDVYESRSQGYGFSGLAVKSLGEHWSVGAFLSAQSSTYSNIDLSLTAAPALEYDVFPYSESTKRQLRLLYRVGFTRANYGEETIYLKTAESLLQESLSIAYEIVRPWGNASLTLEGSHFFHDFSKNKLEIEVEVDFRIWRGLSFEIGGSYAQIHDQLALPAGGASYEEILLRRRQLATGYDYNFSVGLNFSFGSTRSNVVNPRFGQSGGRRIMISM